MDEVVAPPEAQLYSTALHPPVRLLDDGTEEHEYIPIRYQVEVYAIGADPVFTVTTYGSWLVEGTFLIVFDQEGLRTGYRLDSTMQTITTKEYVGKKVEEDDAQV